MFVLFLIIDAPRPRPLVERGSEIPSTYPLSFILSLGSEGQRSIADRFDIFQPSAFGFVLTGTCATVLIAQSFFHSLQAAWSVITWLNKQMN